MTPEEIRKAWESKPNVVVRAFGRALRDFGYNVPDDYVNAEIARLYAGGEPKGGPSMFIAGWLREGLS